MLYYTTCKLTGHFCFVLFFLHLLLNSLAVQKGGGGGGGGGNFARKSISTTLIGAHIYIGPRAAIPPAPPLFKLALTDVIRPNKHRQCCR